MDLRTSGKRGLIIGISAAVLLTGFFGVKYLDYRNAEELQMAKEDIQTSISSKTTEYLQSYIASGTIESLLSDEMQKILTDEQKKEILDAVNKSATKQIEAAINELKEATLTEAQFESLKEAITQEILLTTDILTRDEVDKISDSILKEAISYMQTHYVTADEVEAMTRNSSSSTTTSTTTGKDYTSKIKSLEREIESLNDVINNLRDSLNNNKDDISDVKSDLKDDISDLENKISNLTNKLNDLQSEYGDKLKDEVNDLKDLISDTKDNLTDLISTTKETLENQIKNTESKLRGEMDEKDAELLDSIEKVNGAFISFSTDYAKTFIKEEDSIISYLKNLTGGSEWSDSSSYKERDYVIYGDDYTIYECINDAPSGTSPTNTTYFKKISISDLGSDISNAEKAANGAIEGTKDLSDKVGNLDDLTTTDKDSVVGAVNELDKDVDELKKSVADGKALIASAVTERGQETASDASFETIAENIGKITYGAGNAIAENVLTGKTFMNEAGGSTLQTGTMPNYADSAKNGDGVTLSGSNAALKVKNAGYYNNGSYLLTPLTNFGNVSAANVLTGNTFTSTAGVKQAGTMKNKGSGTTVSTNKATANGKYTCTLEAGYYTGIIIDQSNAYSKGHDVGYAAGYEAGKNAASSVEILTAANCEALIAESHVNSSNDHDSTSVTITPSSTYALYIVISQCDGPVSSALTQTSSNATLQATISDYMDAGHGFVVKTYKATSSANMTFTSNFTAGHDDKCFVSIAVLGLKN